MAIWEKQCIVRDTLTALDADILGNHQVGGFKIRFSKGFRKCRFCMATNEPIHSRFIDYLFKPRTKEQHDEYYIHLLDADFKKHFERVYGITGTVSCTKR